MGFSSLNRENKIDNKENKNGNMGEVEVVDSISSECSSGVSSVGSLESDLMEDEVTSSASSPNYPPPPSASNSSGQIASTSPLHDMSSLMQQLPIKYVLSSLFSFLHNFRYFKVFEPPHAHLNYSLRVLRPICIQFGAGPYRV